MLISAGAPGTRLHPPENKRASAGSAAETAPLLLAHNQMVISAPAAVQTRRTSTRGRTSKDEERLPAGDFGAFTSTVRVKVLTMLTMVTFEQIGRGGRTAGVDLTPFELETPKTNNKRSVSRSGGQTGTPFVFQGTEEHLWCVTSCLHGNR